MVKNKFGIMYDKTWLMAPKGYVYYKFIILTGDGNVEYFYRQGHRFAMPLINPIIDFLDDCYNIHYEPNLEFRILEAMKKQPKTIKIGDCLLSVEFISQ